MNSFDAEMHILRQQENARRAADQYMTTSHLDRPGAPGRIRLIQQRALAAFGAQLVVLGYRMQGEFNQLAVTAESLTISKNEPCVEC